MLSISQAAQRLHVNPKTLRSWADKGFVPHSRTPSGYRRFTEEQVEQARRAMEQGESVERESVDGVRRARADAMTARFRVARAQAIVAQMAALRREGLGDRPVEVDSLTLLHEGRGLRSAQLSGQ